MLRTGLARAASVRAGVTGALRRGAPPAGVAGSLPPLTRSKAAAYPSAAPTCCAASSVATPSPPADVVVAPPSRTPNHRSLLALDENTIVPFVQPNAYVAPSASVIGSVVVNDQSAVMNGAVVRGDLAYLRIGAFTIIGDNCVLSAEGPGTGEGGAADADRLSATDAVAAGLAMEPALFVGDYVDVAPNCVLTGCTLEGENAIGANTVIEPGAVIGRQSLVEPGSVVAAGTVVPPGEAWGGVPAVKLRDVDGDEKDAFGKNALENVKVAARYAAEFLPTGTVYWEAERGSA